jgi:hypothetical protein
MPTAGLRPEDDHILVYVLKDFLLVLLAVVPGSSSI